MPATDGDLSGARAAPAAAPAGVPHPGAANWAGLLALTLVWGTAFLAIDIAVETLPPLSLVAIRVSVAAILLTAVVRAAGMRLPTDLRAWRSFLLLAFVGNALPFTAISWGQQRVPSGVAGILMAVMPLSTLVLAHRFVPGERMTPRRAAGFALGLCGVVALMGPSALRGLGGAPGDVVRQLAVLGAAVCYAVNTILAQRAPLLHPFVASACTMWMASALMVPACLLLDRPFGLAPSAASLQAAVWLGLAATGAATVIYFRIVTSAGPTFLSLMNYGIPVVAMLTGIAIGGEPFAWRIVGALALILAGLVVARRTPRPLVRGGTAL